MTEKEHQERHIKLHEYLDELLADFIAHTEYLPSKTPITTLIEWSYQQTQNQWESNHNLAVEKITSAEMIPISKEKCDEIINAIADDIKNNPNFKTLIKIDSISDESKN